MKILVGINVDLISAEAKRRGMMFFGDPERSRDEFVRWMRADIKEASYKREVEGDVPGNRKKVILISATPLNNRPEDIYHQLLLFQDERKSNLPVTNLQAIFGPLIRKYKEVLMESRIAGRPDIKKLRKTYSQIREKVLEPITVRRTRTDIKNYPAYKKDIDEQGINFPDIADCQ